MKITILCTDKAHPVNGHLERWVATHGEHEVVIARSRVELTGGNILFLVSCSEIIRAQERAFYKATLVLHASALPLGRGWSPHIWQIAEGAEWITLTLLEAEDKVDSGHIWQQVTIPVPRHALWDEINKLLFDAEMELLDAAVVGFDVIRPREQNPSIGPTYYRKRTPLDSRISPENSISSQFDVIRVCDPERFPAFFELRGCKYKLVLEKIND